MRRERRVPQPASSAAESHHLGATKLEAVATMSSSGSIQQVTIQTQVQALERSGMLALRAEWRRLFGNEAPRLSRDLLVRALAYRVQERALGGVSRSSLKSLRELAENPEAVGRLDPAAGFRPGTKLVREWHGHTHLVMVTENGFDYAGSSYGSLTQIAKLITGAHWSGPRFFGLTARAHTQDGTTNG